jgi:hypothetical protein
MRRGRIETLEKRKMFSVTDLILDPFNAAVAEAGPAGDSAAIVDYLDQDETSTPLGLAKGTHVEEHFLVCVVQAEPLSLNFAEIKFDVIERRPEDSEVYGLTARLDLNDLYLVVSRTETVDNNETITVGMNRLGSQFTAIPELDANAAVAEEDGDKGAGWMSSEMLEIVIDSMAPRGIEVLSYSWGANQTGTAIVSLGKDTGDDNDDAAALTVTLNGDVVFIVNLAAVASGSGGQEGEEVSAEAFATVVQGYLLPYIEQDNLYKSSIVTNNNDPDRMITDITDGTSNTMMLALDDYGPFPVSVQNGPTANGIIAILIGFSADSSDPSGNPTHERLLGLSVDTSPIELKGTAASIDIWEHAYLGQPAPSNNGIIAVLIGLAVDPTDPIGSTYTLEPAWAPARGNFALADGSVHFIGASGTTPILSSDEFFARFAGTTLDDEALVTTTYDRGVTSFYDLLISSVRGGAAAQITHDAEFESWANKSRFGRGYLEIDLTDVIISSVRSGSSAPEVANQLVGTDHAWGTHIQSIMHEDNEFYFPRV